MATSDERQPCALCTLKHLSQARALLLETRKGYPFHVWYAMGHLAEAEDEILAISEEFCGNIRELRLALQDALTPEMTLEATNRFIAELDPLMVQAAMAGFVA